MKRNRFVLLTLMLALTISLMARVPVTAQGEKVLRIALQEGDANSLDPQALQTLGEGQILSNIYEGLVQYDPKTLQPVAAIAEKWDVSSDGLKYTFHIRKAVKFHNAPESTPAHLNYPSQRPHH